MSGRPESVLCQFANEGVGTIIGRAMCGLRARAVISCETIRNVLLRHARRATKRRAWDRDRRRVPWLVNCMV